MNGEIPSVPITTLAGVASLTDLIPELPLPTPLPATMNNQSLLFHPKIADEAKGILQTCDDNLILQLVDVLKQTTTEHLEMKDVLACNTIEGSIPELLKGILRKDINAFHGSIDSRNITADITPSPHLMPHSNHTMSPYGSTPPYYHHPSTRTSYPSPMCDYMPGSTINGDCRLMEEAVAPNHYTPPVKASPAHATAADPTSQPQHISPAHHAVYTQSPQQAPPHRSPPPAPPAAPPPHTSPPPPPPRHKSPPPLKSPHRSPSRSTTPRSPPTQSFIPPASSRPKLEPRVVLQSLDKQALKKNLDKPRASCSTSHPPSIPTPHVATNDRTLELKLTRLKIPDGGSSVSVRGIKRERGDGEFTPSLSERVKRRRRQSTPPPTPTSDWGESVTEGPQMSYNFARTKEKDRDNRDSRNKKRKSVRHVLCTEELLESPMFKKFITELEYVVESMEQVDLSSIDLNDAECECPSEILLGKVTLAELCGEAAKLRSQGTLNQIPADKLVKLLTVLMWNIKDGTKLTHAPQDEDDDDGELYREIMMERVMRSMDAALTSIHIMASPNMPKKVYLEDVIEKVNQFSKFQLTNSIYPEFDPVYRNDPRAKGGYQSNLKQKRARAGQVKNKLTLLLYNKITELISGLALLIDIQELTDTSVLQLSSLGVSAFFVENISELQLNAMKLVTSVFSRYGKHRQLILEDIFASLARLPSSKRNFRSFRLSSTESIQMVTALALQFIHCVVRLPKKDHTEVIDLENPVPEDHESDNDVLIVTTYETAMRTGYNFLSVFLKKCTTKGDEDYRPLFENFVLDLLTTVNKPEWPAAELLLSLLGQILVQQFSNKSTDMSLRTASLEYLGIVAARLRKDAVTSHLKQENIDIIIRKVSGVPESGEESSSTEVEDDDEEEPAKHKTKKRKKHNSARSDKSDTSDHTEILQTAMLDYLAYNGHSEPAFLFARQFYVAQWYRDTTVKPKERRKSREPDEEFNASEEEMTTATTHNLERRKAFLLSCIHCNVTPFSAFKPNPSKLAYEDACLVAQYLSSHRPFAQSFDIYLTQIMRVLGETVVAVRTKAMKCLTAVVEADPAILARSDMQKGVHGRFLDQSTSVREAAVELVGKFILIRPELIPDYYEMLSVRILDTGISVRKRVIKIFRDICLEVTDFNKIPEMCVKMIRRVNDEEGIKKLVNEVFHAMWFTPIHIRNKEEEQAKLLQKVVNITDVVAACKDTGLDFFEQLLNNLLKEVDQDGRKTDKETVLTRQVIDSCQQIVDCLVENVLRIEEKTVEMTQGQSVSSQRLIACLSTLNLFSKIKPELMVKHATTLQPYLDIRCSTHGDHMVLHNVARILELVVPLMDHPSESFLAQLEEDIAKLVLKHGMMVVESCVSCLGAVVNKVSRNFTLVRDCFTKFLNVLTKVMSFHKEDTSNPSLPTHKPTLLRSLFTIGLLCKHFDLDSPEMGEFKGRVRERVYETLMYFIGHEDEDVKLKALLGLGFLCIRHYDLMMTKRVKELYDDLLTHPFSSVRLKCQVLKNLQCYLTEEEEKMSKADHEWRKTGKQEDLKEMGDVQSGMASTIMQIYLKQTLESFFHTTFTVRISALNVIALVLNQGLVHPVQCVPYLACMSTDTEAQVRTKADQQLGEIEKKYPGFIYMKALMGVKMSYRLQLLLQDQSRTMRGFREDDMGCMSLCSNLYTILRNSRSQRRTFLSQLLSTFDDSSTSSLAEQIFIADNLAFFPYTVQDEPLYVIHQIDLLVSISGSNIIQSFRENMMSKAGQTETVIDDDDEDDDVQALADRIPDDASALVNALRASQGCVLLLHIKQHLKDLYGFTDSKVHKYSPTESAKINDKVLSRRPGIRFNPTPVLNALQEGTPKVANPIEYHERFKVIEEFIDFKQLMLSVDPPDEDDDDDIPPRRDSTPRAGDPDSTPRTDPYTTPRGDPNTTPRGDPGSTPRGDPNTTPQGDASTTPRGDPNTTPRGYISSGAEGGEDGDEGLYHQPEGEPLPPLMDDVPILPPSMSAPRHHPPTHHSSHHHKPSSRLPQPYKAPPQHRKKRSDSHRLPKPAPRLTSKILKKKKKKKRHYSGSDDESSDDYEDDPDFYA